jgi:hypothetical protein
MAQPFNSYVEQDCSLMVHDRTVTAGGAVVTPDLLIAYLGENGVLTDWNGRAIGTYKITHAWRTPNSHVSDKMFQVQATVQGRKYTGRSAGVHMTYRGRPVRGSK